MGLSFTIAAGPRHRSLSWVRVPRDSWPYFAVWDSRLSPRTWRARLPIYIPQEQGGPVIPPGTGFPFRHLLPLGGLRRRYSNPPTHEISNSRCLRSSLYSCGAAPTENAVSPIVARVRFHGNMFTEPLPSNELFGSQASCHHIHWNIPSQMLKGKR
jgi:hypothetical protein